MIFLVLYIRLIQFDILDALFFEVLNVPVNKRKEKINERYPNIPYLNSSLFEPSELEKKVAFISVMKDNLTLPLHSQTVLTNENVKELPTLDYLLKFLEAYNFASHAEDDIYTEKGELINASVLGLVFEKINGYKEGSFYTPGFITEYMAKETIQKAVIQKFNDAYKLDIADFDELRNYTINKAYKKDKIIEFNKLINSLKIIDPAVGSGHFLVSSLNEILSIKSELGILADEEGNRLACKIEIENDTAVIKDNENKLFRYSLDEQNQIIEEKNKIQSGIFHEKKTIIENCLFGVDINPNSVKICRLRLWIELLKNSYYKPNNLSASVVAEHSRSTRPDSVSLAEDVQLETLPNIDINIKEGNSLISRFPLDVDIKKALKKSKWDIASYQNAVKTYHQATDKNQKREMLRLIETIKNDFETEITTNDKRYLKLNKQKGELFQVQNQGGLFEMSKAEKAKWNKEIEKLTAGINKLEAELEDIKNNVIYRNALEWRFEFPEVLDDNGDFIGFDIVIGNPPYINIEGLGTVEKKYLYENYETCVGRTDIYIPMIQNSIKLLKKEASLTFIIPYAFTNQNYGRELRNYIIQKTYLYEILDTSEYFVFDSANVKTIILQIINSKTKNQTNIKVSTSKDDFINKTFKLHKLDQLDFSKLKHTRFETRPFLELIDIKEKIEEKSVNFQEICLIAYGARLNHKKKKISKKHYIHSKYKEGYKPFIEGQNIERYYHSQNGWLNYKPEEHYNSMFCELFENEKLMFINVVKDKIRFSYDNDNLYNSHTVINCVRIDKLKKATHISARKIYKNSNIKFVEKYDTKFLLALSNSLLMNWYFLNFLSEGLHFYPDDAKSLPIINIDKIEFSQKPLIKLVDRILELKKANPEADTTTLEGEIDKKVYKLYELTEEEIAIVENS